MFCIASARAIFASQVDIYILITIVVLIPLFMNYKSQIVPVVSVVALAYFISLR
jgi:predicted RND superfamily exporter protein